MAEMPVSTGSLGRSRRVGFSGWPATGRMTCPEIGGPPSSGSPRPLQTRPSQLFPTGICTGAPEKATVVDRGTSPSVPSKTWTTARSWSTSRTMPWRSAASGPTPLIRMTAASSQPTPTPRAPASAVRGSPRCPSRRPGGTAGGRRRSGCRSSQPPDQRHHPGLSGDDPVGVLGRGVRGGAAPVRSRAPLDLGGEHAPLHGGLSLVDDGEDRVDQCRRLAAEQWASLADRAFCCSTPSRRSRPARRTTRSCPGRYRFRPGRRGRPGGPPRRAARSPARGEPAHSGSPCSAYQWPSRSASREKEPDQLTAG